MQIKKHIINKLRLVLSFSIPILFFFSSVSIIKSETDSKITCNTIDENGRTETMNKQKIVPCLWFNDNAEEAVSFYLSIFSNTKLGKVIKYDDASAKASGRQVGSVLTMEFELEGYKFLALNGGPMFEINPSISFFLNFDPSKDENAAEQLDSTWKKLSEGGTVLMPLDKYPFGEKYGWVQDKFGVSWQLILSDPSGDDRPFIIPALLFVGDVNGKTEEATDFYMSMFDDSNRGQIARYSDEMGGSMEGLIMYTDYKLNDQWFVAMDGGTIHNFTFNEAISFMVNCSDQEEIDKYWYQLSAVPEAEQCGWLKDKYGVSWQIIPENLSQLISDDDPQVAQRVMQKMLGMKKLDIRELQNAKTEKE
jgi:predicted 3-demethylubiquinone-9 3-methyltransferase (glyoxalase superfamily)